MKENKLMNWHHAKRYLTNRFLVKVTILIVPQCTLCEPVTNLTFLYNLMNGSYLTIVVGLKKMLRQNLFSPSSHFFISFVKFFL